MDLEMSTNTENQSEVVIPETTTKKSGISHTKLNAKAQTFTSPVTPHSKHTVIFAEMASRNIGAGGKWDLSPTPVVPRAKPNSNKRTIGDTSRIQHAGKGTKHNKQPPKQIF